MESLVPQLGRPAWRTLRWPCYGYGLDAEFPNLFPNVSDGMSRPGTTGFTRPATKDQLPTCRALMRMVASDQPARELAAYVDAGLPEGESLGLTLEAGTEFTVTKDHEVVFAPTAIAVDKDCALVISTQPETATYTLDAKASGKVGPDNIVAHVQCAPRELTATEACTQVNAALQCPDYDAAGCEDQFTTLQETAAETCKTELTGYMTCAGANIGTSSACDASAHGPINTAFTIAACQTEIDALTQCIDGPAPTSQGLCEAMATLNCTHFDQDVSVASFRAEPKNL